MPEAASPTVRRRRLAAELRRLRERAGLTGDQVAERMRWSASKVSRIENAHTAPRVSEVRKLLPLYGVDGPRADELLALAQEAARTGWWEGFTDALPDAYAAYIGLEAEAAAVSVWAPETIPGLLQTEEYARDVIRAHTRSTTVIPPGDIERRVEARLARQQILRRDPPFSLNVVIDESALRRRYGNKLTMRSQVELLAALPSQYPDVTLRILPLDGPHPIATGGFVLLQFAKAHDVAYHDIVYLEHLMGGLYFEAELDTYQYQLAFDRLCEFALEPAESQSAIEAAMETWTLCASAQ